MDSTTSRQNKSIILIKFVNFKIFPKFVIYKAPVKNDSNGILLRENSHATARIHIDVRTDSQSQNTPLHTHRY